MLCVFKYLQTPKDGPNSGCQLEKCCLWVRADLFQGHTKSPHHFSIPVKALSASFISALMVSRLFSILLICSAWVLSMSRVLAPVAWLYNNLVNRQTIQSSENYVTSFTIITILLVDSSDLSVVALALAWNLSRSVILSSDILLEFDNKQNSACTVQNFSEFRNISIKKTPTFTASSNDTNYRLLFIIFWKIL